MASAAATLSFHRTLSPPLQPRRRRPSPPACTHSERGVSFDPGSAFYRSDSTAGRDLAVLAATLHRRGRPNPAAPFLCLDAMCGCGVRALRYLAQVGADFVWANDASDALRPVILANLSRFERAPQAANRRWVVSHLDATRLLAERYLRREYFDVIDVDSFGGEAAYIRAAFLALKIGGLLYLTSTDWRSARGYGARCNYGFICHCKSCGQSQTFGFDELGQISCGCTDKTEGYAACRSHIGANAIKTNCPITSCIEVAREIRNLR